MAKAALDQFTKSAAMDLAQKGVRVNSVNPGFIDTDFHTVACGIKRDNDDYATMLELNSVKHPMQRVGQSEDCVNAIAFLADENASFITGVLLRVDGKYTTRI